MTSREKLLIQILILKFTLVYLSGYIPIKVIQTIGLSFGEVFKFWIKPNYIDEIRVEYLESLRDTDNK